MTAKLMAALEALQGYVRHHSGCASAPCQGHYDGTVCTSECVPTGPCDCGLLQAIKDAVLASAAEEKAAKPSAKEHKWVFYANGSFCERCGTSIGSGMPCR